MPADEAYCTDQPARLTLLAVRVVELDEVVREGRAGVAAAAVDLADHERAATTGAAVVKLKDGVPTTASGGSIAS